MSEIGSASRGDFDHIELRNGAVAGPVPATPRFDAQSQNNRGGRNQPGHDPGRTGGLFQTWPESAL